MLFKIRLVMGSRFPPDVGSSTAPLLPHLGKLVRPVVSEGHSSSLPSDYPLSPFPLSLSRACDLPMLQLPAPPWSHSIDYWKPSSSSLPLSPSVVRRRPGAARR